MKRINKLNLGLTLILLAGMMAACVKGDYDTPPINIPTVDFNANYTILKLKQTHIIGNLPDSIKGDTIIKGVIIGNDESGNIYKQLIIQDGTSGIVVNIDRANMYTEYKVGQRVFIKCKGMYIGDYNSLVQIGYIYQGGIGQLPSILVPEHIFKDSLPGKTPEPVTMSIPTTINPSNVAKVSTLVKFENVQFVEAGQVYCPSNVSSAIDRTIKDANGTPLIVRNSKHASFASALMPSGTGTVVGILSNYRGKPQLVLRDTSDVYGFTGGGSTPGTFLDEAFDSDPTTWIKYSVASNKDWTWDSQYSNMTANGYGGDVASDDWLITPEVDLSNTTVDSLTFRIWKNYTDNGLSNPFEVLVSSNYSGSGNPTSATWTKLSAVLPTTNNSWITSALNISNYKSKIRIAFHYRSSGTTSNTSSKWEVDDVKIFESATSK